MKIILALFLLVGLIALIYQWFNYRKAVKTAPDYAKRMVAFYLLSGFTILVGINTLIADAIFQFFGMEKPTNFDLIGLLAYLGLCTATVLIFRKKSLISGDVKQTTQGDQSPAVIGDKVNISYGTNLESKGSNNK